MLLYVELKPGEGGKDAVGLCKIQKNIYIKFFQKNQIEFKMLYESDYKITIEVKVEDKRWISGLLSENGGHRWQRVPPSEKRSRVHTSTVKVSVTSRKEMDCVFKDGDFSFYFTKDSGPGGQHRNKTESCVVMTHVPTGIKIKAAGKNQHQNRRHARKELEKLVSEMEVRKYKKDHSEKRRGNMGSGQRGDKIRTYREVDNQVITPSKKVNLKKVLSGSLDLVW